MPAIDPEGFLQGLQGLRRIRCFRTGVHRPTYSPRDMESRRWLAEECGLEASVGGIGDVHGRYPPLRCRCWYRQVMSQRCLGCRG